MLNFTDIDFNAVWQETFGWNAAGDTTTANSMTRQKMIFGSGWRRDIHRNIISITIPA